jgi:hypothetical protein
MRPTRGFRLQRDLAVKMIVALGVALRVADYLRRISLNIDESRIALNIGLRSYAALFPPLDQAQSAPVLFLWAEKLVVDVLGWSELTLRAIPLLAGIATVLLMVPVARRLAPPRAALLAVALVACAPGLVAFSAVLKQYSLDGMCSVLLLRLFLVWREPTPPRSAWPLTVTVGAVVLWASAPVVFVVAGAWLAILLLARRGAVPWSRAWTAAAVWGASFGLVFKTVYRGAAEDPYLHHFWAPAFVRPFDLASLGNALVTARSMVWGAQMETLPFIPRVAAVWVVFYLATVVLIIAAVLGAWRLGRSNEGGAAVPAALFATAGATLAGLYPLVQRTTLFAIPLVQLCIAVGLNHLIGHLPRVGRAIGWAVVMLVVLGLNLLVASLGAINFNPPYHVAPLIRELRAWRAPGEPIYIGAGAIPAWTYYSTDWARPDTARIGFMNRVAAPGGPAFENAPSRHRSVGAGEGAGLEYTGVYGHEILGLPSGIESTALTGPVGEAVPDSGWAIHEARRIRSQARPAIWVLMAHHRPVEMVLFAEIERLGGRRTLFEDRNSATLARYEFTPEVSLVRGPGPRPGGWH